MKSAWDLRSTSSWLKCCMWCRMKPLLPNEMSEVEPQLIQFDDLVFILLSKSRGISIRGWQKLCSLIHTADREFSSEAGGKNWFSNDLIALSRHTLLSSSDFWVKWFLLVPQAPDSSVSLPHSTSGCFWWLKQPHAHWCSKFNQVTCCLLIHVSGRPHALRKTKGNQSSFHHEKKCVWTLAFSL